MSKIKIGIVGCGTIGSFVAERVLEDLSSVASIDYIFDIDMVKAQDLKGKINDATVALKLQEVFYNCDLVVEAAAPSVVEEVLFESKSNNTHVVIMSVAGLLDKQDLLDDIKRKGIKIYIPSGAIGGLDILRSLEPKDIDSITLTTFKPPAALVSADYVVQQKIDLYRITSEMVVFEGSVDEAVKYFPKNINVAAALAVSSRCREKITVKIVASPTINRNIHHVVAEGEFGKAEITCENHPSRENPGTSQLALWSCMGKVKEAIDDMLFFKKQHGQEIK